MKQMSEAAIASHNRYQRDYYDRGIKKTMIPKGTPYLRRHVEELARVAQLRPGERILDVGCGMGRYTLLLAEKGFAVEGLDLSPVLLQRLRVFNGGRFNIPLHSADVMNPPADLEERFDVIVGFFALHHMHELERCFRGMRRMVKPGGRVVFLEPNAFNPLYYAQMAITPRMTWQGDKGVARMRMGVVADAMTRAGLESPTVERFGFFPPFIANTSIGARAERVLERLPVWKRLLPFQIFRAERP
jgi:SAM-dependent methyltransferase